MQPVRAAAIVLRQYYLLRGSASRVLPLFVWVAIDMVLWGYMARYLNTVASGRVDFVPALLGAVLFWDFQTRVMNGVTMAFLEDVWSRNFLNLFASPLSIAEYLSGLVFTAIVTSAFGLVVMLIVAVGVFGLPLAGYGVFLVPCVFVLFLFGIALGIVGSAVVLRFGPAAEWFVWPIPAIVSPFAAVFYPLATLPPWMQAVGRVLPPSYVFEAMRAIVAGGTASGGTLAWAVALAALEVVAACWLFTAVYRHAVRAGLIARYSAETVS